MQDVYLHKKTIVIHGKRYSRGDVIGRVQIGKQSPERIVTKGSTKPREKSEPASIMGLCVDGKHVVSCEGVDGIEDQRIRAALACGIARLTKPIGEAEPDQPEHQIAKDI